MYCMNFGSLGRNAGNRKPMKPMASTNIRIGPITQFCTSDNPSTFQSRNTSPSSSYFTLASGGYIMRISPMAMGMFVVPA